VTAAPAPAAGAELADDAGGVGRPADGSCLATANAEAAQQQAARPTPEAILPGKRRR